MLLTDIPEAEPEVEHPGESGAKSAGFDARQFGIELQPFIGQLARVRDKANIVNESGEPQGHGSSLACAQQVAGSAEFQVQIRDLSSSFALRQPLYPSTGLGPGVSGKN